MIATEEKKIWKNLWKTFMVGLLAIIFGFVLYLSGYERKLILFIMCAYVFGVLAIVMSLYKMRKFKKYLKSKIK